MKIRNYLALGVLLITLDSCSSESPEPIQPDNKQKVKITVLEKDSRKPISGAFVELLKCSIYDFQFGCTGYVTVGLLMTNTFGEIEYNPKSDVKALITSHPDYWEAFKMGDKGEIILTPNAWVKVKMEKIGTYDSGSYVNIQAKREECYSWTCAFPDSNTILGLPSDTTFVMKVRATEKTTLQWFVRSPPSGAEVKSYSSQPFVVGKSDTLNIKTQY